MRISIAGTGYVGLSIATLLAQHNEVTAVDIVQERVDMVNNKISPIQDDYIEEYLKNKELNLRATIDAETGYKDADFVVIAAPTNYDSVKNFFEGRAGLHGTVMSGNETLEETEEKAIRAAMARFGGNLSMVAKSLEISRPTLYAKLKKYNI